jgi:hypothetical protein
VRVHADRALVVPEVPRIEGREKRTAFDGDALSGARLRSVSATLAGAMLCLNVRYGAETALLGGVALLLRCFGSTGCSLLTDCLSRHFTAEDPPPQCVRDSVRRKRIPHRNSYVDLVGDAAPASLSRDRNVPNSLALQLSIANLLEW